MLGRTKFWLVFIFLPFCQPTSFNEEDSWLEKHILDGAKHFSIPENHSRQEKFHQPASPIDSETTDAKLISNELFSPEQWTVDQIFTSLHLKRERREADSIMEEEEAIPNSETLQGRIVGGDNLRVGDAPHQVEVHYGQFFKCGGVLVKVPPTKNQVVLTTATCVSSGAFENQEWTSLEDWLGKLQVVAGRVDRDQTSPNVQIVYAHRVIRHPHWVNTLSKENDIAIIILEKPFKLGLTVDAVNLPPRDDFYPPELSSVSVSSWGWTSYRETKVNTKLQTISMSVSPLAPCKAEHRHYPYPYVYDGTFCAWDYPSDGAHGLTRGDSGAAAVTRDIASGTIYLAGIFSRAETHAGGNRSRGNIFTRVSYYNKWIRENGNPCSS